MNHNQDVTLRLPLTVEALTKRFGRFTAVQDLSFTALPERATALWGVNGAGKTTVIKCILGLLRYQGRISVGQMDLAADGRSARRLLGYVPQELAFYDDLTVTQTAHFFARLRRVDAGQVPQLLEQVELGDHTSKPVRTLSGGLKQRLALALALLGDPPVLILDEPTSNLDARTREAFLHLLGRLKAQGKTLLFTSHRIDEVETLADEVLVMEQGKVRLRTDGARFAGRMGITTRVKFLLDPSQLDNAMGVLQREGFEAQHNGAGVFVSVAPDAKAGPIHKLSGAGIHVTDFEIE